MLLLNRALKEFLVNAISYGLLQVPRNHKITVYGGFWRRPNVSGKKEDGEGLSLLQRGNLRQTCSKDGLDENQHGCLSA